MSGHGFPAGWTPQIKILENNPARFRLPGTPKNNGDDQ